MRAEILDAARGVSRRRPSITIVSILSLALTLAITTYTVVDAVMLRPLPFGDPERLVDVSMPGLDGGALRLVSPRQYYTWLETQRSFEGLGAARLSPPLEAEFGDELETLVTRSVSAGLFDLLRIRPAVGRWFGAEDERPGGTPRVVLSHSIWVRRFASDPSVVGRQLLLGREVREVVGVLPAGISYPATVSPPPDLYIPALVTEADRSNAFASSLAVVGRLRPGATLEDAEADLGRSGVVVVQSLQDRVVGSSRRWLWLVLGAVVLVVLGAGANVSNLLVSQWVARGAEFAIREALGASRARIWRSMILDGFVLTLAAALVAAVCSLLGVRALVSILADGLPLVSRVAAAGTIVAVAGATVVLCTALFVAVPALFTVRFRTGSWIREGSGPIVGGRLQSRALHGVLCANLALTSAMLFASTLMVTSFINVVSSDLGFERANLLTFSLRPPSIKPPADGGLGGGTVLRAGLLNESAAVDGVVTSGFVMGSMPMTGGTSMNSLEIPGLRAMGRDDLLETAWVTPSYFDAMGIPAVRGRLLSPLDRLGAPPVILINDVAARRYFGDRNPIGTVVVFDTPRVIVGVAGSVRYGGPEADPKPAMYVPIDQDQRLRESLAGTLVVRTNGAKDTPLRVRNALLPILGSLELSAARSVDGDFHRLTAGRRTAAGVMVAFGVMAMISAAIGVYGTSTFVVSQQTRAIGVRIALGATPERIFRSVLARAGLCAAIGAAMGLGGSRLLASVFESLVFEVRPTEPDLFVAVAAATGVVGILAAVAPAVRASKLDPLIALKRG